MPDSAPLYEHGRLVLVPGECCGGRLASHLTAPLQRPPGIPGHVPDHREVGESVNHN